MTHEQLAQALSPHSLDLSEIEGLAYLLRGDSLEWFPEQQIIFDAEEQEELLHIDE